jgi:hypothetical protein
VSDEAAGTLLLDQATSLGRAVGDRSTGRCATRLVDTLALFADAILAAAFRRATAMECFVLRLVGRENVDGGKLRLTLLPLGGSNAMASALVKTGATTATNATIHNKPIVFLHESIETPQLNLLGYTE